MLVLDAGDALYKQVDPAGRAAPELQGKAAAILEAMSRIGYAAMGVGPRDLAGGLETLRRQAKQAGIELVSANLVDARGRRIFPASRVVERGGLRIGIVGVSTADPRVPEAQTYLASGITANEPAAAARAAAAELPADLDLVVLLGRLQPAESRRVVAEVPEARLALLSASGRIAAQGERVGESLMYEGGLRGQLLLRLELGLGGPGPLTDPGEIRRPGTPPPSDPGGTIRPEVVMLDERVEGAADIAALVAPHVPEKPAHPVRTPAPGPRPGAGAPQ